MAAPTVAASGWHSVDLTSAQTGSQTKAAVATSKAVVAMVCSAQAANQPSDFLANGGALSYGNLGLVKVAGASAAAQNTIGTLRWRKVEFFFLDNITGRADDVFRWTSPTDASDWAVSMAVINHDAKVAVTSTDTFVVDGGSDTGDTDSDVILAYALACLGLVASMCDNTVTNKTGQTTVHSRFIGIHHSMQSSEASVTSDTLGHNRSFSSGPWVAGGLLLGGADVVIQPTTRIEGVAEFRAGFLMLVPTNILWQPARVQVEASIREGFRMLAVGPRQVVLVDVDGFSETPLTTEGGTEGQALLYHTADKPGWGTPPGGPPTGAAGGELAGNYPNPTVAASHSGSTHASITADINAHLADAVDAHDASAVSIVDAGGFFTGTEVEAALQELGGGGATIPPALKVFMYERFR